MIARTSAANLLTALAPLFVGLVTVPIVLNGYGMERYGILAMAQVLLGYFGLLDLGIGRATTRFASQLVGAGEKARAREVVSASIRLTLCVGVAVSLLLVLGWKVLGGEIFGIPASLLDEASLGIAAIAIAIPLSMLGNTLQGALEAAGRFRVLNVAQACIGTLGLVAPVALAPFTTNVGVCLMALSALKAVHVAILLAAATIAFGRILCAGSSVSTAQFAHYSRWIFLTNLMSPVLVNVDRLLLGRFASLAAVTHFSVPFTLVSKVWLLPIALCRVLFPYFGGGGGATSDSIHRTADKAMRHLIVVIGIVVIPLVALAYEVLVLWVGGELPSASAIVLQILALGVWVNSIAYVPYALLQARGRPDIPAKWHVLEAVLYLPALCFLITKFGVIGAAVGWTGRVCLDLLLLLIARRSFAWERGERSNDLLTIPAVVCTGLCIAASIVTSVSGTTAFIKCITAATLTLGWVVTGAGLILTSDDRRGIRARIGQVLARAVSAPAGEEGAGVV